MIATETYNNEMHTLLASFGVPFTTRELIAYHIYEGPFHLNPHHSATEWLVAMRDDCASEDDETSDEMARELTEAIDLITAHHHGWCKFDMNVTRIVVADMIDNGASPSIRSDDGYTFHFQRDGSLTDGDMSWDNIVSFIEENMIEASDIQFNENRKG